MLGPVMQFKPEIADNYDWDAWARGTARNAGLPERWLAHPKIVQAIREQRAQQQAEMQQQAQMAQMAESDRQGRKRETGFGGRRDAQGNAAGRRING